MSASASSLSLPGHAPATAPAPASASAAIEVTFDAKDFGPLTGPRGVLRAFAGSIAESRARFVQEIASGREAQAQLARAQAQAHAHANAQAGADQGDGDGDGDGGALALRPRGPGSSRRRSLPGQFAALSAPVAVTAFFANARKLEELRRVFGPGGSLALALAGAAAGAGAGAGGPGLGAQSPSPQPLNPQLQHHAASALRYASYSSALVFSPTFVNLFGATPADWAFLLRLVNRVTGAGLGSVAEAQVSAAAAAAAARARMHTRSP